MKIMMVEPLGDGGITHYTYNLVKAIEKIGVEVTLFTSSNYEFAHDPPIFKLHTTMFRVATNLIRIFPALSKETNIPSIFRRTIKLIEYPINTFQAMLLTLKNNIKVIHFQSVNLIEVIMIVLFKLINRKVIYTIHNVMPRHKTLHFYHKLLYGFMYFLCDKLIIHTEKGKNEIIDLFGVDARKIHVVPHGDYKFFAPDRVLSTPDAKSALNIHPKYQTILFFGAIRKNKGLEHILLALPMIKERIPDVHLLIVGELWEDYTRYRRIITANKLERNVWEKLEYISNEDVALYFCASDVVILPYNEITGSGVLQIAYAFAKPVVASDLPSFREIIVDGKNGYLVDPNDHQNMAEKVADILVDNNKRERMGKYSRFLADTRYTWDTIAENTKLIYLSLLQ